VIFRAESVPHIGVILSTMAGANGQGSLFELAASGAVKPVYIISGITGIICSIPIAGRIKELLLQRNLGYIIDIASVCALIYCAAMLAQGAYTPFIYFRF
jgi:hypothetical protein